jgi:MFS family permease
MNPRIVYYIIQFLEGLGMGSFYPIYTPWMELHGLNFLKMGYVNFIYHITASILDPFTGFIADKFGKRKTFIVGQMLWTATQYIYGASSQITGFMFAEGFAAVGYSLKSDALESWLQNKLGKDESSKVMSKSKALFTLGQISTSILAGYISAKLGMQIAWYVSGTFFLIATVLGTIALISAGDDLPHENNKVSDLPEINLKQIVALAIANKKIRATALLVASYSFASKPLFMYWPQIVEKLGMPEETRGWTILAMSIPIMGGSLIAGHTKILKHNKGGLIKILTLLGIGLAVTALANSLTIFFMGLALVELSYGAVSIVTYGYLYEEILPAHRSTTNSLISSVKTLGGAASLLLMGALADLFSPQTAVAVGSAFVLAALVYHIRVKD